MAFLFPRVLIFCSPRFVVEGSRGLFLLPELEWRACAFFEGCEILSRSSRTGERLSQEPLP